jgi:hypothetical protein
MKAKIQCKSSVLSLLSLGQKVQPKDYRKNNAILFGEYIYAEMIEVLSLYLKAEPVFVNV